MEKNRSIATLQLRGGHPSLDLANTVAGRRDRVGPDLLVAYGDLLDWSLKVGLLGPPEVERLRRAEGAAPGRAEAALARAKRSEEHTSELQSPA